MVKLTEKNLLDEPTLIINLFDDNYLGNDLIAKENTEVFEVAIRVAKQMLEGKCLELTAREIANALIVENNKRKRRYIQSILRK